MLWENGMELAHLDGANNKGAQGVFPLCAFVADDLL
jgi:hypothetical protein